MYIWYSFYFDMLFMAIYSTFFFDVQCCVEPCLETLFLFQYHYIMFFLSKANASMYWWFLSLFQFCHTTAVCLGSSFGPRISCHLCVGVGEQPIATHNLQRGIHFVSVSTVHADYWYDGQLSTRLHISSHQNVCVWVFFISFCSLLFIAWQIILQMLLSNNNSSNF